MGVRWRREGGRRRERCVADADAELVEALRRNTTEGAERLVERYGDRAYRLALRITGTRQDAESAVEEGLRAVLGAIHTFTGASTFESWIVRSVASAAYQRARRCGPDVSDAALAEVVPPLDGDGRHFAPMGDWSNWIDEPRLARELYGVLTESLEALPADYRTALVLHDVEHASKPDIAAVLGVEGPGVSRRVHYARLFVRKRLSEYFESAAAA
jgi:RNA polymerase sigma-70 factor, ECF subfamily